MNERNINILCILSFLALFLLVSAVARARKGQRASESARAFVNKNIKSGWKIHFI